MKINIYCLSFTWDEVFKNYYGLFVWDKCLWRKLLQTNQTMLYSCQQKKNWKSNHHMLFPPIRLKRWVCSDWELVVWESKFVWRISGLSSCCLLGTLASQRFSSEFHLTFCVEGEPQEWEDKSVLRIDVIWRERGSVQLWSFPSRPLSKMSLIGKGLGCNLALFTLVVAFGCKCSFIGV